jgi:hypothetical protein
MPPRTRAQGESKQGYIIALVVSSLLLICLGVSTYFGFADQDKLDKAAKEAKKNEDTFKSERDYYKAQSMVYRGYMGLTEGMDGADTIGTLKDQLEGGSLGKGSKDNADVTKVLGELKQKYGWDKGNQPLRSLEGTIKTLTTQVESMSKDLAKANDSLKKAQTDIQKKDEELGAARQDFEKKLVDLSKKYKDDFEKSDKDLAEFRTNVVRLDEDLKKQKEQLEQEKKTLEGTIAKRDGEIRNLKQLVQRKQDEIDQFRLKNPEAPLGMRTDWRIVRMDDRGTHPYINLGSVDQVKPRLTFNVYGVSADGRPNPQPKATIEVVNVLGPHLSQARITSVRDSNRDPVTERDVIYNASWNPFIKKRIAIAGIIDLGDGRDSLMEFMRNLERQNVVVDAYEDPKDGSMKGQITYQTDFLVLGGLPARGGIGRMGEAEKRIIEGRKHMQDEAKKYGVEVKNLGNYLELIGYPLPYSIRAGTPTRTDTDFRSDIVPRLGRDKVVPSSPAGGRQPAPPPNR